MIRVVTATAHLGDRDVDFVALVNLGPEVEIVQLDEGLMEMPADHVLMIGIFLTNSQAKEPAREASELDS